MKPESKFKEKTANVKFLKKSDLAFMINLLPSNAGNQNTILMFN